jgi:hypothetical protein
VSAVRSLGSVSGNFVVFNSDELRKCLERPCWQDCAIVKVKKYVSLQEFKWYGVWPETNVYLNKRSRC